MEEIIAYHGTTYDFTGGFKQPEDIQDYKPICNKDYLGIYFSESKDVAKMFCKEKWYVKSSKLIPDSKIYKVRLKVFNPKIIYPIEHCAYGTGSKEMFLGLRAHLAYHHRHDALIIQKSLSTESFKDNKGNPMWRCEYTGRQIAMFYNINIELLEVIKLN